MRNKAKQNFGLSAVLWLIFAVFTLCVLTVDVSPIGPQQSKVGLSSINAFVFQMLGTNKTWYTVTEFLGIAALFCAAGFGAVGVWQLLKRRNIRYVDRELTVLGCFYVLVAAIYLLFEQVVINYRPILVDGVLEVSYPSSHVLLVTCIAATAAMQTGMRNSRTLRFRMATNFAAVFIIVLTAIGRLLSGVHWFTDIVGALLLAASLVTMYCGAVNLVRKTST